MSRAVKGKATRRITIPPEVVEILELEPGDMLCWEMDGTKVTVRKG